MPIILFDLGGTYLRCGTTNGDRPIRNIKKARINSFLDYHDTDIVWKTILCKMTSYIEQLDDAVLSTAPIVLAFPGPIQAGTRILNAPTVIGRVDVPDLRQELINRTGREVYILNDVSAAAWYFSEQLSAERFMVVTISSGIGSKVFDRRHPAGVLDNMPYAGEIGHMVVDESADAPTCDCGGKGHLGAISSGRGVMRAARAAALNDQSTFETTVCARKFGAECATLTNEEHLVPAAKEGDEWALEVIREASRPLARVLTSMVLGIGLEVIVIIGGFALSLGSVYLRILRNLMREGCDYSVLSGCLPEMLRLGTPGEEACLEGGAVYARRIVRQAL